MKAGGRGWNLAGIGTRFNVRVLISLATSILLCTGIAGCAGDGGTVPGSFVLSTPADDASDVWLMPTLTWTDATGETSYTVEIDNENTFSAPLVHQKTGIAADTTSYVVPGGVLTGGNKYYWKVIAVNSAGSTTASNAPFSFNVLASGALVPGFGTNGVVTYNPSPADDVASGIAIDSTAIYVIGYDSLPGTGNNQWRIEKRSLADGSLVTAFGASGTVTSDPTTGADRALGIAVDSTAMYVVGCEDALGNQRWRIEKRSLTDGNLIAEFGAGGVVTNDPSPSYDAACAIAIDSTAMYVVGYDSVTGVGNYQWRIEKRSLTSGSLVTEFGTGGVVTNNPSGSFDRPTAIAIDASAIYVVGYDCSYGATNNQWRIEKRSLADGSLVTAFGTGGVATNNPSSGGDVPYGVAIDSTAMYVVGTDFSPGNYQWRIEKRSLTSGSLVGTFTWNAYIGDEDKAYAIAIDSTAMYVVGYADAPEGIGWEIQKRSLADGNLDPGFGMSGDVYSNPSPGVDTAYAIAMDSTAIYVVGDDMSPTNFQWRIEKRVK